MAWSRSLRLACVAGAALAWACISTPAPAQQAMEGNNPPGYTGPKKKRMSSEELGRLRMLEIKSGAFRDAKAAAVSTALVGPPLSDREKVQHAMARLSFGAKLGDVERVLLEGGVTDQWKSWVKAQLNPEAIDDSELEKALPKKFAWYGKSVADLKKDYPYRGDDKTWEVLKRELPQSVVMRAALSKRQFNEVMAEFWRQHFTVDNSPSEARPRSWAAVHYEDNVIRPHVMGKFKNMLFASARHPAMLDYLDNRLSKAGDWNENYARELMELHTVGADRGYGNADVVELSKVLTGWNYNEGTFAFEFRENWHQGGYKQVMGYKFPSGYAGGEQAVYMLATHKNTAEFISTKLLRYLVNDEPSTKMIADVAAVFTKTEGDLRKVYEAIVYHPEFFERANYRSKFKTPFEFCVSAARAVDAKVDDTAETTGALARMGMEVYNCPDPTGYYDRAEAWMDAGVLTTRWDYSLELSTGAIKGITPSPKVIGHYKALKGDERFVTMIRDLIGDDIGDRTRQTLKEASDANDVPRMIGVLLGSPSFQQQ